MTQPLHMPSLQSPFAGKDAIAPPWAKYLREIHAAITAELSPGRIAPFYLSAADMLDAAQFVQTGSTAGLGVGIRLGWALCNGNNGTPSGLNGKSLRWSTTAAGTDVGSDTSEAHAYGTIAVADHAAHSHTKGTLAADSHTLTTAEIPAHHHMQNTWGSTTGGGGGGSNWDYTTGSGSGDVMNTDDNTGGGGGHSHTVSGSTADNSAQAHTVSGSTAAGASSTGNVPASKTLVPLMRV